MKHLRAVALVLTSICLFIFLFNGCATLFTGSSDSVTINSDPSGAKAYLNGNFIGNTPVTNVLKRDKDYNVVVKKDGYEPANGTISRSFNAVAILNLLSPLCWIVDVVTGAMWKFDQNAITVTLEKSKSGEKSSESLIPGKIVPGSGMAVTQRNGKTLVYLVPAQAQ
jgi:hypothetical protein